MLLSSWILLFVRNCRQFCLHCINLGFPSIVTKMFDDCRELLWFLSTLLFTHRVKLQFLKVCTSTVLYCTCIGTLLLFNYLCICPLWGMYNTSSPHSLFSPTPLLHFDIFSDHLQWMLSCLRLTVFLLAPGRSSLSRCTGIWSLKKLLPLLHFSYYGNSNSWDG
jgi:hypothetical protein